jgi:MFS family permease
VSSFLALPLWGRICDRFGCKPIILLAVLGSSTHPFYYLVARSDMPWPVYCDAISSGIVWSGFNLATFNLVLAAAPRGAGREMYYAAYNGAGGLAMAIVSAFSGALVDRLPELTILGLHMIPRQVVFFSVIWLRLLALVLLARVVEPRRER